MFFLEKKRRRRRSEPPVTEKECLARGDKASDLARPRRKRHPSRTMSPLLPLNNPLQKPRWRQPQIRGPHITPWRRPVFTAAIVRHPIRLIGIHRKFYLILDYRGNCFI
jgi:hypothetical protein